MTCWCDMSDSLRADSGNYNIPLPTEHANKQNSLRDRIVAAILSEDDIVRCADAVIAALTEYYHVTERAAPLDPVWEKDD